MFYAQHLYYLSLPTWGIDKILVVFPDGKRCFFSAASVKGGIMPYFPNIMSQLNGYLSSKAEGDDIPLQVEAIGE